MEKQYRWKDGIETHLDVNVFVQFVKELTAKLGHAPSPEELVEAAKDPDCPLHEEFYGPKNPEARRRWEYARAAEMDAKKRRT
jgi:hypothetical protein